MSASLKNCWLKKSKISFFSMFYIGFLFKKWAIRSFPLFWWVMWVNCSGRSLKMSKVSESLRSLTKNERPWAIRSGRSEEMSDHERIAQDAHQKGAIEWIAHFFERIAHLLNLGQKTNDSLGNQMSEFPALVSLKEEWFLSAKLFFRHRFVGQYWVY